jgi:hypothetical protein
MTSTTGAHTIFLESVNFITANFKTIISQNTTLLHQSGAKPLMYLFIFLPVLNS